MHCDCFKKFQDVIFVDNKLLTKAVETMSLENLYVYAIWRTGWYHPITLNKQPGILIDFNARFTMQGLKLFNVGVQHILGNLIYIRGNMVYTSGHHSRKYGYMYIRASFEEIW